MCEEYLYVVFGELKISVLLFSSVLCKTRKSGVIGVHHRIGYSYVLFLYTISLALFMWW